MLHSAYIQYAIFYISLQVISVNLHFKRCWNIKNYMKENVHQFFIEMKTTPSVTEKDSNKSCIRVSDTYKKYSVNVLSSPSFTSSAPDFHIKKNPSTLISF